MRPISPDFAAPEVQRELVLAVERDLHLCKTVSEVNEWAKEHGYQAAGAVRLWQMLRELSGEAELARQELTRRIQQGHDIIKRGWGR